MFTPITSPYDDQVIETVVRIVMPDSDAEQLETLTHHLKEEIRSLDVDSIRSLEDGSVPPGAKSLDPTLLGVFALTFGPTLLTKFLEFIHAWTMRQQGRTVKLKFQMGSSKSLEVEVPADMPPVELEKWINTVTGALLGKGKK